MKSTLFGESFAETQTVEPFALQNERMLKIRLDGNEIRARQGSMVAYQGDLEFQYQGAGAKRLLKKVLTGEDLQLMTVSGRGELFLADHASEVHLIYLENDSVTVNGDNILAFDPSLTWDVKRVQGGITAMVASGFFNITLEGSGWVALTSRGTPVVLNPAEAPTFADTSAVVAWSTSLQIDRRKSDSMMKTLIGRGSGELYQMAFAGQGFVIVQPAEQSLEGLILSLVPSNN